MLDHKWVRISSSDGDGNRVKSVMSGVTTYYIGNHFEWTGSNSEAGTPRRIEGRRADGWSSTGSHERWQWQNRGAVLLSDAALELYFYTTSIGCGTNGATSTLTYLHGDHLGSASLSTNAGGSKVSDMRYYPYGETRSGAIATDRRYTGQRQEAGLGLYDYNARYYDPYLNRFIQADTIVPSPANPQTLNRYAYTLNNPLKYTDPSGHFVFPVTVAVGALVGGLLTTGTYLLTTNANDFNGNDLAAAMAVGIVGGALIGTGVGITAGAGVIAGVMGTAAGSGAVLGAAVTATGVGAVASAEVYMATSQSFDRTDFYVESVSGALEGGFSALTGGWGSVAGSGFFAAAGSIGKDIAHNREIDWQRAGIDGAWGLASGFVAEAWFGGFKSNPTGGDTVNFTRAMFDIGLEQELRRMEAQALRDSMRTVTRDTLYGIGSNWLHDRLVE